MRFRGQGGSSARYNMRSTGAFDMLNCSCSRIYYSLGYTMFAPCLSWVHPTSYTKLVPVPHSGSSFHFSAIQFCKFHEPKRLQIGHLNISHQICWFIDRKVGTLSQGQLLSIHTLPSIKYSLVGDFVPPPAILGWPFVTTSKSWQRF